MATDNPSVDIDALVKIYKEAVKKGDSHRVDLASSALKSAARAQAALAEASVLSRVAIGV
jgi:hypothetical protein